MDKVPVFVLIVVGTAALLLATSSFALTSQEFPQMLLFVALIVAASFLIIRDPSGGVVSSAGTLFYVVLYVFHPVSAFIIVSLGYGIGNTLPRSWVTWRACFNGAQMGLSVFAGSLAFRALGGDLEATAMASQVLPALMGALVHQIANNFFVAFLISEVRNLRFLRTWVNFTSEHLWTNLLGIPTAILIAILYTRVHHAFALMFLLSLPFQRWALRLYLEKRNTYARVIEHLVRACELSLPGTRGHSQRVAALSIAIARQLGLSERDVEAIEYAALLHDIGMIGMDDAITLRDASADSEGLLQAHARVGAEIVSDLGRPDITEMVRNHHSPYRAETSPDARRNPASIGARIIAVAEEADTRIHGLFPVALEEPAKQVIHRIEGSRGTRFDPQVVDAFLAVMREEDNLHSPSTSSRAVPAGGLD